VALLVRSQPSGSRTGDHYLDDGGEACTVPNGADLFAHPHGAKQWAADPAAAQRLWTVSLGLLS
jgi:hypothetical protein